MIILRQHGPPITEPLLTKHKAGALPPLREPQAFRKVTKYSRFACRREPYRPNVCARETETCGDIPARLSARFIDHPPPPALGARFTYLPHDDDDDDDDDETTSVLPSAGILCASKLGHVAARWPETQAVRDWWVGMQAIL